MSGTPSPSLRSVLEQEGTAFGGWCAILDSVVAEIVGTAGFDWCCIDLQHGAGAQDALVPMLQGFDATGAPSIVRVPWNEPAAIMRALDAGAQGVIVPMVDSVEQAVAAANACRYAPAGNRSWGPSRAALGRTDYMAASINAEVVCLPMVESTAAVAAAADILAVDGVDGVFIGPSDLSVSLGVAPSDSHNPVVQAAIAEVLASCRRAGKIAGIFAPDQPSLEAYAKAGFDMVAVHNDMRILSMAARSVLKEARAYAQS